MPGDAQAVTEDHRKLQRLAGNPRIGEETLEPSPGARVARPPAS
mgnify:CR=1 FL=1